MKNKVPEIRFAGFEGEWDYKPLSEYLTTSKSKNRDNRFGKEDVLSVSREFGVINQIEYQGRSFAGASVAGYGVAEGNDVIYTKSPLRDQPYGIIKTNKGEPGIVSALYAIYHPNDNVEPDFLQTFFDKDKRLNDYLRPIVHKGAKNTLNIGDEEALAGKVCFPKIDEQRLITSSFRTIDEMISRMMMICEKLHNLKSSLLSSLFPEKDELQPRLRLEGFSGDWTGMIASSIFQPISDKGHPELPILSASQELGMIPRSDTGINMSYGTQNIASYKRVCPGQFVIHLRSFQGGFAHSDIEGITSPAYTIFRFKDESSHDATFWRYVLVSKPFIKRLETVTYGIRDGKSIKFEDFANMRFLVPSVEEQKAIADLLTEYDRLIQLNEQKLENLRNVKQAMLDKMFV